MNIETLALDQFRSRRRAVAIFLFCMIVTVPSTGQTFTNLVNFGSPNGVSPFGVLVQGLDGNFYGTTAGGGTNSRGTVFKVTPAGQLSTIYNFCSQANCADGSDPRAGLVLATDGNFYGTTALGGANCPSADECGTVFRITAKGQLTRLYTFCSQTNCADGQSPLGSLIQAADGNFYGTTTAGAINCYSNFYDGGCGTIFKITPTGKLTTLYSFCSTTECADGGSPTAGLVQANDGNFYGTTPFDGNFAQCYSFNDTNGCGTLFRITPAGKLTTLYRFCTLMNCEDGFQPWAGLVFANDGEFYGTTLSGGAGNGTVFKISTRGKLATLHNFQYPDGSPAQGTLIQATDGNLYGTTVYGGTFESGTIFEITPAGSFTNLYDFCSETGCPLLAGPEAGLTQGTDGNFYGTTLAGGNPNCGGPSGCGTIFRLSTGLAAFVRPNPLFGKVGNGIKILGNNLKGVTSVTFNGTEAEFTVVSSTYIKAIVPSGATTGIIEVTTAGATLSSNVSFQVIP
jgi:uncharacterized repeat protein (TIGR03803 family)